MREAAQPPPFREKVLDVLRGHLSTINAMGALRIAEQAVGIAPGELRASHMPAVLDAIRGRLPTYLSDPSDVARCLKALAAVTGADASAPSSRRSDALRVEVSGEDDIIASRSLGRQVCQDLGFGEGDQLKVMTAISEVARNIVQYAKRGQIEIRRLTAPLAGIEIVARDNGPGIANIEHVLAGRYKSKLGMGMGLRGAKALMDEMHVRTALGVGTTVTARKYRR